MLLFQQLCRRCAPDFLLDHAAAKRNAGAGGGVFAIGDDEVELVLGAERGGALDHDVTAGFADDISDEEELDHGPTEHGAAGGTNRKVSSWGGWTAGPPSGIARGTVFLKGVK